MLRLIQIAALMLALVPVILIAGPAQAGSPHFIKSAFELTETGATLTVSGKEAGLGDETQVHIEVVADASCINRGGHNPNADNKDSFGAAGDFPVQNGQAEFTLTVTATFQPACVPPMTLDWTRVTVTDTEHGVTASFNP